MKFESLDGYQMFNPTYGCMLREHRVRMGLTQKQVAEKAKIPFQSYQRFESDESNIMTASFQMTCRVLDALGMDISGFYHGEYVLSAPITPSPEGLRYKDTGKLINEDVTEETLDKK